MKGTCRGQARMGDVRFFARVGDRRDNHRRPHADRTSVAPLRSSWSRAFVPHTGRHVVVITTPEAWVENLGVANFGVPYLSGAGRLVIKDILLFAGSWLVVIDGMRDFQRQRAVQSAESMLLAVRPAPPQH
jgi:hypothetical protein